MRDHMRPRRKTGATTIGVRELKTHAARIVRQVREEHASYVVTHRGRAVGVILPLASDRSATSDDTDADPDTAWAAFLRAGRRLERRLRPNASGVDILSAMRR